MISQILKNLQIEKLNPMQLDMLKAGKTKKDIVLLSPTGSGKTIGFLLPIFERLDKNATGIQAMVIAPSRELAIQIEQVFKKMNTGFKVNVCYGGHEVSIEKNNLSEAPAVLIGTPGRIVHHIRKGNIDANTIRTLVLDEFDKALEFGFQKDLEYIISHIKKLNKLILTSATNAFEIPDFVRMEDHEELNYLVDESPKGLKLKYAQAEGTDKLDLLFNLVCKINNKPTLIFCNHKEAISRISALLKIKGLVHDVFHGDMEQDERERALIKFRNGSHQILIASDLAARGLDIPEIENVIHYQVPHAENAFIHRNGRTARMNANGTAYVLLTSEEKLPEYLSAKPEKEIIKDAYPLPEESEWITLYLSAGKKDKVNKIDIVGFLIQKGGLQKEELGKVEVLDNISFAAVKKNKVKNVLQSIKDEKLKKKSVKIDIAN